MESVIHKTVQYQDLHKMLELAAPLPNAGIQTFHHVACHPMGILGATAPSKSTSFRQILAEMLCLFAPCGWWLRLVEIMKPSHQPAAKRRTAFGCPHNALH
jgi:hypothetical protein